MDRAVYRIIDANFNRSREGLRVMEEFCRFALNSKSLNSRAKEIRHRLCDAMKSIELETLVGCRDSAKDVGSDIKVTGQMKRGNLTDCFKAASKRATEALRALSETSQVIDMELSAKLEAIRFDIYTLEKDIVMLSFAQSKIEGMQLYVLVTVGPDDDQAAALKITEQCAKGGVDCIQLRCKQIESKEMLMLASKFVQVCKDNSVISIINDRVDIAVLSDSDGVHVGEEDLPIDQVRRLGTKPLIVGVTTHNVRELQEAIDSGADYVGIGPVFDTATKPGMKLAGLDYVQQAAELLRDTGIGHVAIGGISELNVRSVVGAGARAVAVCSAATGASDPQKACEQLKQAITSTL